MSNPGNTNGSQIDDPVVNSAVVGVDMLSGDGNNPENPPTGDPPAGDEGFDPSAATVDDVKSYVEANPDERQAVLDAETAGKNRTTLVAWLEDESAE